MEFNAGISPSLRLRAIALALRGHSYLSFFLLTFFLRESIRMFGSFRREGLYDTHWLLVGPCGVVNYSPRFPGYCRRPLRSKTFTGQADHSSAEPVDVRSS